jgi:hypothetical protein
MKKTLIAMAVLAASGASFAQVSITGAVALGYEAHTSKDLSAKSVGGFGVDTSAITFSATEDIGGGMKAGAVLGFDGMNRKSVGGADTNVFVQGDFGKVTLASGQGSDYLSGGISGVAGIGLDGKTFSGLTAGDSIAYALPAFGPFTVTLNHEEVPKVTSSDCGLGIGSGGAGQGVCQETAATTDRFGNTVVATTANATGYQRRNGIALAYSAGALKAATNYQSYDHNDAALTANTVSRVRASAAYDFGVVKVGGGVVAATLVKGTQTDTLVGIKVPVGAMSFGLQAASRTKADTGSDGTTASTGVSAAYALSPRTSLSYSWVKYDAAIPSATTQAATFQNLLLAHSF